MAEEYVIQKKRVQAEILTHHQEPQVIDLFLSPSADRASGFERASEALSRHKRFFPCISDQLGVVFFSVEKVLAIAVDTEIEFSIEENEFERLTGEESTRVPVSVLMCDGTPIEGEVHYLLPEGNNRLQDFLELPDPFFAVRAEKKTYLVNKRQIVRVSNPKD